MRTQINQYIQIWQRRCYSDLPDEAPQEIFDQVPSYKKIVLAIFKNDLKQIGIEPPKSQYYGILKCIELGKTYIKPKRMTQQENREFIFRLINTMIERSCYIKGYGTQFRVVDSLHNPVVKISTYQMNMLLENVIVERLGLIFVLCVIANKFTHPSQILLPAK